ncbi:hypothetical protein V6Z11_A03G206000 [Gossypium hirsutum]
MNKMFTKGDMGKLPGSAVNNNQGLRFISNNMGFWRKVDTNIAMKDVRENDHSPPGAGSGLPWCSFSRWYQHARVLFLGQSLGLVPLLCLILRFSSYTLIYHNLIPIFL